MIHQTAGSELENMFIVLADYFINLGLLLFFFLRQEKDRER